MTALRKLVSILLLAVFGLPFVPQLLAATAKSESNLPACCRRSGKHRCMEAATDRHESATTPRAHAPLDKCPYAPATLAASHRPFDGIAASSVIYAEVTSHPSVRPQAESKRRISAERSRSKRGPPTLVSL